MNPPSAYSRRQFLGTTLAITKRHFPSLSSAHSFPMSRSILAAA